jgi:hypothetical protein
MPTDAVILQADAATRSPPAGLHSDRGLIKHLDMTLMHALWPVAQFIARPYVCLKKKRYVQRRKG